MVKRYAGGVITSNKPSLSVLSATGIFSLAEQAQAKTTNTWPTPIYTFPAAYNSLITSFVGTVIYVDASIGSDSNTGSSITTPYATIDKAHAVRSTLPTSNVMIVVRPGTYNVTLSGASLGSWAFFDFAGGRTVYVCAPGQVIFNYTASATYRDVGLCKFSLTTSAVYGAIINRNNGGKTLNYSTAFFNNTTVGYVGSMVNCAISEVNANNTWAVQYDNSAAGTGSATNCSFYNLATGLGSYGGSASLTLTNCAFNYGYGTEPGTHTNELILTSHNMTSGSATPPYVSPGTTTQGVYYGTYAWA